MLNHIYWHSCNGVLRYILLMSIVMHFALGVLTILLKTIFAVSKPTASVLVSPWNSNRTFPTVICVRFTSSFSGHLLTTTCAYVAVLFFCTCSLLIQNSVFVLSIHWVPSDFFHSLGMVDTIHLLLMWASHFWILDVQSRVCIQAVSLPFCRLQCWPSVCVLVHSVCGGCTMLGLTRRLLRHILWCILSFNSFALPSTRMLFCQILSFLWWYQIRVYLLMCELFLIIVVVS